MEKKKYSFKCLEQNCTNRVCCTRPHITVTLGDLGRWSVQGYLENILPGLELHIPQKDSDKFQIETIRKPIGKSKEKGEETACVFFHEESNACMIRYSRPISCRTFPLKYNGSKFILSDKNCPGIGGGEVTKEALKEARELAEQEFREQSETIATMPAIYTIIAGHFLKQSAETMKHLSEEDRKRLEEIMSRAPKRDNDVKKS